MLLAIIGPRWLLADKAGRPRILEATDWVRIEIETALTKKIPVIPVLIDEAGMPKPDELPDTLQEFAYRQAAGIDTDRDFHDHMDRLIDAISDLSSQAKQCRRLPMVDTQGTGKSSSDTFEALEAKIARRPVASATKVVKAQPTLASSRQVAKVRLPSSSSPQAATAGTTKGQSSLPGGSGSVVSPSTEFVPFTHSRVAAARSGGCGWG